MALAPELQNAIIASVEKGFDDQIAYTRKLVSFASVRGAEHAVQDFTYRELSSRGYVMDRFAMDRAAIEAHPGGSPWSEHHSKAPIVVAIHHPRQETGRSLILQSHLDVVLAWARSDVAAQAIWRRDRGRLDVRPRRGRHEGRCCRQCLRARCAASSRPAAGGDGLRAVSRRGRIDRQRRPDDASARLQGRCGANPRAGGQQAGPGQCRRDLVPGRGARRARACTRDGSGRQCHRCRLPGDRPVAPTRSRVEHAQGTASAFRE